MKRKGLIFIADKIKKAIFCLLLIVNCSLLISSACAADEFPINPLSYRDTVGNISADINNFGAAIHQNFDPTGQLLPTFIPVEAKVGLFFMDALSSVVRAIYTGMIPFLNAFLVALFAFWIFMETWQMMKKESDIWDLATRIVKKAVVITIWMWILNNDPAELFMWIMSPIITVATNMSDLILDGTAKIVGTNIPDTCNAIHEFVGSGERLVINGEAAANLLCMPTRAASFFYTAVAAGFDWMKQGLLSSALVFFMGLTFVLIFIYTIWKFALEALGVIVDLFFVLLFLPFTAIQESFGEKKDDKNNPTKYDGIFKPLWTELVGLIKGATLSSQIKKFLDAMIYFVVLAIVAAISVSLLAGVNPRVEANFMAILIIGGLVMYLIGQVGPLAKKITGSDESKFGKDVWDTVSGFGKTAFNWGKKQIKVIRTGKEPEAPKAPADGANK